MGKNKRSLKPNHARGPKKPKADKLTKAAGISKAQKSQPTKKHKQIHRNEPTIPFSPSEHILLIGEGDLSFARSLVEHHVCTHVTATVLEGENGLLEKHPHIHENIKAVEDGGGVVRYGVDASKMKAWTAPKEKGIGNGVLGVGRQIVGAKGGMGIMDRIMFNFPHVGGKTKDVNRQVRYNQELLVSFFKRAIPSLSPRHGSSIVVTLFEGEPYTLWNIRDLARHSGLEVLQSFKFQAAVYPGYKHARTLGVVKTSSGEASGGWKGEERAARSYVFVRKGEGVVLDDGQKKKVETSDDESSWDGDEVVQDQDNQFDDAGTEANEEEDEGFRQG